MKVIYQRGFAINKRVGAVINSANGFLLLGSSGAGAIRNKSQSLTAKDKKEYKILISKLPKRIREDYIRVYRDHGWTPTYAQLGCIRLLLEKKGDEFKMGDAVLQTDWSKKDWRPIIHAIGMSYRLGPNHATRLHATRASIRGSVKKSLKIADSLGVKSIALPVMCARPSYGIGPEDSLKIILSEIKSFKSKNIIKVIICFDNSVTRKYLNSLL